MSTVWKIAPGDKARVWEETREQRCITINWANQRDLSRLSKEGLAELVGPQSMKQVWEFVHEVRPGDTVVANKGASEAVGIGVVESSYLPPKSDKNPRKNAKEHRHCRIVDWQINLSVELEKGIFGGGSVPRTVIQLSSEQCQKIKDAYLKRDPSLKEKLNRLLPSGDVASQSSEVEESMKALLQQLKQIIVYGPPGTGKTRESKRIALSVLRGNDVEPETTDEEVEAELNEYREEGLFDLVVFHPSYEYEQFVGGIGPAEKDSKLQFETKAGSFLRLCRKAEGQKSDAVLIIDEINRGNLPKLLGELVYALEYRNTKITLPFRCDDRDDMVVPNNLFVIATMNSSDRSIGHIDVAVRRRFGLYPMDPESAVVRNVWKAAGDAAYGEKLADLMDRLNKRLRSMQEVGSAIEFGVGQSYFLPSPGATAKTRKQQVQMKWKYQVQPLLREYHSVVPGDDSLQEYFTRSLDDCLT
ncbi:MAG: AAA family ATPase [Planctomyces sp.]|nr:AAA family ATPase [Planctomyces sp.]